MCNVGHESETQVSTLAMACHRMPNNEIPSSSRSPAALVVRHENTTTDTEYHIEYHMQSMQCTRWVWYVSVLDTLT